MVPGQKPPVSRLLYRHSDGYGTAGGNGFSQRLDWGQADGSSQ